MPATDEELLAAYRATVWTVYARGGALRVGLERPAPPASGLLPAAILTAYNPLSVLRPDPENRAADERLRAELARRGASAARAVAGGTGPDADRWTEPGFAVTGLPLAEVVALAAELGQNAIAWIDESGTISLVATRAGFCGRAVGETIA